MLGNSSSKFALLIPCYNAEKFVIPFLENIETLNKKFDEVLFYDDASTDDTVSMLEKHGQKVIKGTANKGPAFARNILATTTSCNWFHFHDIDDLLHAEYLEKVSDIAMSNDVDIVLCNVDWLDSNKSNIIFHWEYSHSEICKDPIGYTISHPIGGINGLYKKSAFEAVGGFDTDIRLWEDADIHVRLAANNARFYIIEEVLSFSIRYYDSLSANQNAAWLTRLSLLQKYFKGFNYASVHTIIGHEAQRAASKFLILNMVKEAEESLMLSELCGVPVPNNKNLVWKILKTTISANLRIRLRILQLQFAFRKTFHEDSIK